MTIQEHLRQVAHECRLLRELCPGDRHAEELATVAGRLELVSGGCPIDTADEQLNSDNRPRRAWLAEAASDLKGFNIEPTWLDAVHWLHVATERAIRSDKRDEELAILIVDGIRNQFRLRAELRIQPCLPRTGRPSKELLAARAACEAARDAISAELRANRAPSAELCNSQRAAFERLGEIDRDETRNPKAVEKVGAALDRRLKKRDAETTVSAALAAPGMNRDKAYGAFKFKAQRARRGKPGD